MCKNMCKLTKLDDLSPCPALGREGVADVKGLQVTQVERADEIVPVDLSVSGTDLDSSELGEVSN
jgi:hypothetical protein